MISFFIVLSIAICGLKMFFSDNIYEKITIFYFVFTAFILLILLNTVTNFDDMLDIVIVLFLLQFVAILFLLFNRKKV